MALKDTYDFDSLVNEAERLVVEELEAQLKTALPAVCRCQDCVLDMAAYALNNVKPSYRVSLMGSVYAKSASRTSYAQEITRVVREAIGKISANPSHD
jgi:competence protein ComFB